MMVASDFGPVSQSFNTRGIAAKAREILNATHAIAAIHF